MAIVEDLARASNPPDHVDGVGHTIEFRETPAEGHITSFANDGVTPPTVGTLATQDPHLFTLTAA